MWPRSLSLLLLLPVEAAGVLPNRDGVEPVEDAAGVEPKRLLLPNKEPLVEEDDAAVLPNSVILHGGEKGLLYELLEGRGYQTVSYYMERGRLIVMY